MRIYLPLKVIFTEAARPSLISLLRVDKSFYYPTVHIQSNCLFLVITQPPIYGVIVYFLLCNESVNNCLGNSFGY